MSDNIVVLQNRNDIRRYLTDILKTQPFKYTYYDVMVNYTSVYNCCTTVCGTDRESLCDRESFCDQVINTFNDLTKTNITLYNLKFLSIVFANLFQNCKKNNIFKEVFDLIS